MNEKIPARADEKDELDMESRHVHHVASIVYFSKLPPKDNKLTFLIQPQVEAGPQIN